MLLVTQCTSRRFSNSCPSRVRWPLRYSAIDFSLGLPGESAQFLRDLAAGCESTRDLVRDGVAAAMERTGMCLIFGLALLKLRPDRTLCVDGLCRRSPFP